MMRPEARVIVIGTGQWGKNLLRNFHDLGALAGFCEANSERRTEMSARYPGVQAYASIDEALNGEGSEALAIATPAATHGALVRQCLEAGRDVFVEKPMCLSVGEAELLTLLARQQRRILMVGHVLWYHPAILKLKELIDEGELGRIRYIYSNRLNLGRIRQEENILWSFAPHDISVILGLLGEMPDDVVAHGAGYVNAQVLDVTVSHMFFASGVRAHIFVSWLHPFKEQKLVVVGDRKMAVFNGLEAENTLVVYPHVIEWRNRLPVALKAEGEPVSLSPEEPLRAECSHFLDCLNTRDTPRTDGEEGLRVLKVLDACQAALRMDVEAGLAPSSSTRADSSASRDDARPGCFIHETAVIDPDVRIGRGTKVWHFSHVLSGSQLGENCTLGQNVMVGPDVSIGDGVKIQNNVSVYRGVTLEDDVFCGPSMVFTNVKNPRSEIPRMRELQQTIVRRGASLGANCTIVCGHDVGSYAFVAAGSVVTRDVPDFALVMGNPARIAGWVCRCGERLKFAETARSTCPACGAQYVREDARVVVAAAVEKAES